MSGYVELDAAIGGFKRGSVVLCSGPSGSGVEFFAASVLANALTAGEGGAIVLTSKTPSEFRKSAYKRGFFFTRFEEAGNFSFVDAYSRIVGGKEGSEMVVNGPSDLAGIIASVAQCNARLFRKGVPSVFVLDSLSGLMVHSSKPLLSQFLGKIVDMFKKTGAILFVVFMEPFEESSLPAEIAQAVDVRLEFKQEGGKIFVNAGDSRWVELGERRGAV